MWLNIKERQLYITYQVLEEILKNIKYNIRSIKDVPIDSIDAHLIAELSKLSEQCPLQLNWWYLQNNDTLMERQISSLQIFDCM